jgi:hypothetical protein
VQAENTLKVISKDPSFRQKIFWTRPLEIFNFEILSSWAIFLFCPYKSCYFSHFYLFLPNFLPIGILMKFLVWRLSGPFKTILRPEKSKKLLKIFLSTILYEMFPLWHLSLIHLQTNFKNLLPKSCKTLDSSKKRL